MLSKTILLTSFIILSVVSFAQFNDSVQHYVNYAATGVINRTNNNTSYLLSNTLKFQLKKKKISLNSNNSYVYGETQTGVTNRDLNNSLDFNILSKLPRFYYWGLVNYDKSYSLKIINRLQSGIGVAYSFVDKPNAFVNLSDGIIYESSNLRLTDSTNDLYQTFRNSLRLRYRIVVKDIFVFNGTNFYQPSLSISNDYIIQSVNSLSIKLRKWLSFTTTAVYNKVERTNRENLLLTFGLSAETYF